MSMRYYKMANSNIFSNIVLTEYIKRSEDNWKNISDNFSNSVFSAAVSVLSGIKLWENLNDYSFILKVAISLFFALLFFIGLNLIVSKIMMFLRYLYEIIFCDKISEPEKKRIREYFYTELQPLVVMGLSLSQRVVSNQENEQDTQYKNDLDSIYLYQCLYYFNEILECSIRNRIYDYGRNGDLIKIIGEKPLICMYQAVINQLNQLKVKYNSNTELQGKINALLDDYTNRLNEVQRAR